jgi:hypothetical protein
MPKKDTEINHPEYIKTEHPADSLSKWCACNTGTRGSSFPALGMSQVLYIKKRLIVLIASHPHTPGPFPDLLLRVEITHARYYGPTTAGASQCTFFGFVQSIVYY